jgi:outer membrane protein assembly factor BamA
MPLVNTNPAMKTSFGGIGMYMFSANPNDQVSPPSTAMLTGLYSTNKSYVFAAPLALFLAEDTWRLTAGVGTVRINNDFTYDVDGPDVNLVYSDLRDLIFLEASRKIAGNVYLGVAYFGSRSRYRFDQGSEDQNEFAKGLFQALGIGDTFISSLGLKAAYDSRDYPYFPTSGTNAVLTPVHFAKWLGSETDFSKISYDIRHYHLLKPRHRLSARLAGGHSVGDVPFSGYQSFGSRNNLRGYPGGKYRGRHMIGLQAEYGWQFYGRWGMVAFGGVGSLWGGSAKEEEDIFEKELLPSIGTGIRFMLSEERKINLRLDAAWGINGNHGLYLGIMEAF